MQSVSTHEVFLTPVNYHTCTFIGNNYIKMGNDSADTTQESKKTFNKNMKVYFDSADSIPHSKIPYQTNI